MMSWHQGWNRKTIKISNETGPNRALFTLIFLFYEGYHASYNILLAILPRDVYHNVPDVFWFCVWNNMIMIPFVKIGRWAKNDIKQVHSAVYSCSSSYYWTGILLIFRYTLVVVYRSYPLCSAAPSSTKWKEKTNHDIYTYSMCLWMMSWPLVHIIVHNF